MSISENIYHVRKSIINAALKVNADPNEITIVAVTKNAPPRDITKALNAGITAVGENRVQEMLDKYGQIDGNIRWHFIGSLQTNKVRYIIDKVCLIHSLDRLSLANEINKRAESNGRKVQTLIQVNISREASKSGIYEEDLESFIEQMSDYRNVEIKGLMTIGPHNGDKKVIRTCFRRLKYHFEHLKKKNFPHIDMKYLSMGMTDDFTIAIEEGANMVRIGRAIFTDRPLQNTIT